MYHEQEAWNKQLINRSLLNEEMLLKIYTR